MLIADVSAGGRPVVERQARRLCISVARADAATADQSLTSGSMAEAIIFDLVEAGEGRRVRVATGLAGGGWYFLRTDGGWGREDHAAWNQHDEPVGRGPAGGGALVHRAARRRAVL